MSTWHTVVTVGPQQGWGSPPQAAGQYRHSLAYRQRQSCESGLRARCERARLPGERYTRFASTPIGQFLVAVIHVLVRHKSPQLASSVVAWPATEVRTIDGRYDRRAASGSCWIGAGRPST